MANDKKFESKPHVCPYCDTEVAEASFPFCQACQVQIRHCPECEKPVSRDSETCPNCGVKIKS